nr:unnamed protein product [Callosobruchus chinensis]
MSSYSTALRRTIRWYKKVAIEVLLVEQSDNSITYFRYSVIEDLLQFEGSNGYEYVRPVNVNPKWDLCICSETRDQGEEVHWHPPGQKNITPPGPEVNSKENPEKIRRLGDFNYRNAQRVIIRTLES